MNRREFIHWSTGATLSAGIDNCFVSTCNPVRLLAFSGASSAAIDAQDASVLAGTSPLTQKGDFAAEMVEGIHRFLLAEIDQQAANREKHWNRDYRSAAHYEQSIEPKRQHLRKIIGAVDERVPAQEPELLATLSARTAIAQGRGYKVYAIRWRVFAPQTADSSGLQAEGLLLQPDANPLARVVAIPDADWTPEMLVGLAAGVAPESQFARRLAENGIQVVVPLVINRDDKYSGIPGIGMTNMSHREWIYRMAFEVGRHIIGFEVQKVLAAIDWFEKENTETQLPIGVAGYGEGGLLALYTAAIDNRVRAALVSGYFQPREQLWQEPIYRDLWGLLREFGDAELASMIAPRTLIVEACQTRQIDGPPKATGDHKPYACPNGAISTPTLAAVISETDRARPFFKALNAENNHHLIQSEEGHGPPGSEPAITAFVTSLGVSHKPSSDHASVVLCEGCHPMPDMHRQFNGLVEFTQSLIQKSPEARSEFWKQADASSINAWKQSTRFYRDYIWNEVIGRLPAATQPANPRTRLIYSTPQFRGYEVMLNVWPDVFSYGILLIPNGLRSDERRPVVVCQHGLEGRPSDVSDPTVDSHFYHHFAASLAQEGFVTYAPQNPYIGEDRFRIIQRMGHPLKLSLFSFILGQHEQLLNWLTTLPFVEPEHIGFYGLSYGGKTAVRVPPLLERYALSICSGDFNEWVWKTTNVSAPQSYMLTKEYDMYEFDFANKVNYSDLANLMAPRPFMVERGHDDPVSVDEWVAFEYAKVRRFYDQLGIGDKTEIEFFSGPHEVHGKGTFQFLKRHL